MKGCSGPCSGTLALSALFPRDNQQLRLPAHPHTAGLKRHRPASRGVSCSREDVCSRETSAPARWQNCSHAHHAGVRLRLR